MIRWLAALAGLCLACSPSEPVVFLSVIDRSGKPAAEAMVTVTQPDGQVFSSGVNAAGAWHSHWFGSLHPLEAGDHTVIVRMPDGHSESRPVTAQDFRESNPVALVFQVP